MPRGDPPVPTLPTSSSEEAGTETGPGVAPGTRGVVFDTDGVLLDSASLHAAAWKVAFDRCIEKLRPGDPRQPPFDANAEYRRLVDGKARLDGARAFLKARGIVLPLGAPDDQPGCTSIWAVAADKELAFTHMLSTRAVPVFDDVAPALRSLRARGVRCVAASASRHAGALLEAAGILGLFDTVVDGRDVARLGLPGKPNPALFLEAASRLGLRPAEAAVVEDAEAGVAAARRGGFGLVVGLDRTPSADRDAVLHNMGADVVLRDLAALVDELPVGSP
ncbi:HAD-IA family hydrolase [Streptomyces sp. TRM75563]|uniref:HAD family hydrolase n=1 Tax=Streptomyces sp. TRM75563 TaxID=2817418 RepID=UPI001F616362|nr:HAD-IA family hydrolase [Streptomyces sp. TRM75563]MCI4042836.1 HAD-IA family hydrolase [Streptomyces sp. TRM75563]